MLTQPYWTKKVEPLVCSSFLNIHAEIPWVASPARPETYSLPYSTFLHPPHVTIRMDPEWSWHPNIIATLHEKWPHGHYIYTDGSRINERVGCAFYDSTTNILKSYRLWDHATVFSAEQVAILRSILYANTLQDNTQDIVILSDSQSSLIKLKNINPTSKISSIEGNILRQIRELQAKGIRLHFLWIKAHTGIQGNEIADTAAKQATNMPQEAPQHIFPHTDLYWNIRTRYMKEWQVLPTPKDGTTLPCSPKWQNNRGLHTATAKNQRNFSRPYLG